MISKLPSKHKFALVDLIDFKRINLYFEKKGGQNPPLVVPLCSVVQNTNLSFLVESLNPLSIVSEPLPYIQRILRHLAAFMSMTS